MPTVRITKRPWEEIEVGDVEYAQLKADGLLVEDDEEKPKAAAPLKKSGSAT